MMEMVSSPSCRRANTPDKLPCHRLTLSLPLHKASI
jgi:hypothetical protein